jgi:hypothetical protein
MNPELGRRVFLRAVDRTTEGTPRAFAPVQPARATRREDDVQKIAPKERGQRRSVLAGALLGVCLTALAVSVAALFTSLSCAAFLLVHGGAR